jgi:hypothetical protein
MRTRITRTLPAVAGLALALTAGVVPADAAAAKPAKRPKPCPTTRADQRTTEAVAYTRPVGGYDTQRGVFGCHLKTRRRTLLGVYERGSDSIGDETGAPPKLWLSGRHAALASEACSTDPTLGRTTCSHRLTVTDLRSSRTRHMAAAEVAGLLLKPNGSLAYVDSAADLTRVDKTGTTVVDTGAGIDPDSLASDGRHLYWLQDGQPRVAPFD